MILRPVRGQWLGLAAASLLVLLQSSERLGAQCGSNPVVCENALTGDPASAWDITGAGDSTLQGFATDISVNKGGTVAFKVTTTAATFKIDIYRLGYYGGLGARRVATISNVTGKVQPACLTVSATGLIDCGNWTQSASWAVPSTAVSGIYLAKLSRADSGGASHIVFVVRDDASTSDLLYKTSDTTWQAYNDYGGNSLYTGAPGTNPNRAYKVSYNRPFNTRGNQYSRAFLFGPEYPMVRWLEANGYNVSYLTGVDTARSGALLLQHKTLLSVGHDEYWSAQERTSVEAARAAGKNLAFFSGDEMFWKTRWEASIDGSNTAYRTLVSYKETHANAKLDPQANVWTGTWRDPRFSPPADGGRPENAVTGTMFMENCCQSQGTGIGVSGAVAGFRFWRNTLVAQLGPTQTAQIAPGILGYEVDTDSNNGFRPQGLVDLSSTTYTTQQLLQDNGSTYAPGTMTHNVTQYRHSSGALVFGAGTIRWSWGLDPHHDLDSATPAGPTSQNVTIAQATVNLLADMGAQPATLQPGLSAAAPTSDVLPPTSTITSPASGVNVPSGAALTITGTATDASGGVVAGVEVSTNGGTTWSAAVGGASWTYSWMPTALGPTSIVSRAIDDSGNIENPTSSVPVTVVPGPTLGLTTIGGFADSGDNNYLNGSLVTAAVAGQINSMSVYVGGVDSSSSNRQYQLAVYANNAGKPGALIAASSSGTLTANTWNTLPISASLQAGASYWLMYNSNGRTPSVNNMYFDLASGGQGAYSNAAVTFGTWPSTFPASTLTTARYSLFATLTSSGDTTPPTVTGATPANGATGVGIATSVTATFSEAIDQATLNSSTFVLRTPTNTIVAGTIGYNSGTKVATLTPSQALAASTTYTATITGGSAGVKDLAGNALLSNYVWSFTTLDVTPPTITATSPASGATGVAAASVTATFSEAMTAATVTTTTFVLRTPANALVPATVSYNGSTNVATLTPSSALSTNTTYTATITGGSSGVKDAAGNALVSNYTWSFTTGATNPPAGLTTIGGTLDSGDSNFLNGSIITTTTGGPVSSMSVYVGPIDTNSANRLYQVAIYTNNAGKPGTLVATSASGTLAANAWNTLALSATLQPGTSYWLLFNTNGRTDTVNNMYYNVSSAGQGVYSNAGVTFGSWPATFPASTLTTAKYSLYATFAP